MDRKSYEIITDIISEAVALASDHTVLEKENRNKLVSDIIMNDHILYNIVTYTTAKIFDSFEGADIKRIPNSTIKINNGVICIDTIWENEYGLNRHSERVDIDGHV